jgi:hypothetical protein
VGLKLYSTKSLTMDIEKFRQHLDEATKHLIVFTRTLCFNDFAGNYKYLIIPNSRIVAKNEEHLDELENSVLTTWNKYENKLLTAEQVVELFHHNNKVPVWVNISVYQSHPNLTVIELFCSRRLREEKELMHPGIPPFHLQVKIPPDHLKIEREGKFDVNWKRQ